MSFSTPTIAIHTLNILIGIISIAILALVAHTIVATNASSESYPSDVKGTGRSILFWPGVGGTVDMLLFLFLWFKTPAAGELNGKRKVYWNGLLFVSCLIFARPFITIIYTFVEWGQAVKGQINASTGYITTESWACAATKMEGYETVESVCGELRAARYLLILEVVFGAIMLSLVIWMRLRLSKNKKPAEQLASQDAKV